MQYESIHSKLITTSLVYSNDKHIRYISTAGGYISTLIQYLFDSNQVSTAITFERNGIVFSPKLIYSYNDYKNIGSLYQEIDIISFLKNNHQHIKGTLVITVLPCQVNAVRLIATKHKFDVFIISLVCSAQMNLECTSQYLKLMHVEEKDIKDFRYRGKGWPKYISIELKNNKLIEEKQLWNQMFHSYFFHEKRCLKCSDTFGLKADLAVSDPWLGKSMEGEKIGKSIVYIFTNEASKVHKNLSSQKYIQEEKIDQQVAVNSQLFTMKKKYYMRKNIILRKIIKVFNNKTYKRFVLSNKTLIKLHSKILNKIIVFYIKKKEKEYNEKC